MPERVLVPITPYDVRVVKRLLALGSPERLPLSGASLHLAIVDGREFAVVGPAVGAPAAASLLENLAVLGAKCVIAFGWCGSLQSDLKIGSLLIPRRAIREEGTSFHYLPAEIVPEAGARPAAALFAACQESDVPVKEGTIWTTDALYREARAKVMAFQESGVLAVEMETSAIFAVSSHLGIESAILLIVSDELAGEDWRPGFLEDSFREAHEQACRIAIAACSNL